MAIKILGISGSYRGRSGTTEAVSRALEGAASIEPAVETKLIKLRGKKISPCMHCDACYRKRSLCVLEDDFLEILDAILEADGFIIGSPVYEMNYTPVLNSLISRLRCTYLVYPGHFVRRVGAAIAVGGNRNGGQEMVLMNIQNFYNSNDIITCGGTFHSPGGACLVSPDGSYEGTMQDTKGLEAAYSVGQRLAQTAALLKFGEEKYQEQGYNMIKTKGWYDVQS